LEKNLDNHQMPNRKANNNANKNKGLNNAARARMAARRKNIKNAMNKSRGPLSYFRNLGLRLG
jgi:hypothetical protein